MLDNITGERHRSEQPSAQPALPCDLGARPSLAVSAPMQKDNITPAGAVIEPV